MESLKSKVAQPQQPKPDPEQIKAQTQADIIKQKGKWTSPTPMRKPA